MGVAAGIGIASLPLGTFAETTTLLPLDYTDATTSQDVKVGLDVDSALTIASEKTECVSEHIKIKSLGSCAHLIAGGSNNETGFTISVAPKATIKGTETTYENVDLINSNGSKKDSAKIVAKDGELAAGDGAWNISGGSLDHKALTTASQDVLKTTAAGEDETTMTYNFATRADQERGSYTTTITYTIADNETSTGE